MRRDEIAPNRVRETQHEAIHHDPVVVRVAPLDDGTWRITVTGDFSLIDLERCDPNDPSVS